MGQAVPPSTPRRLHAQAPTDPKDRKDATGTLMCQLLPPARLRGEAPVLDSFRLDVLLPEGTPERLGRALLDRLDESQFREVMLRAARQHLRDLGLDSLAVRQT